MHLHPHDVYAISPRGPQKEEHLGSGLTLIIAGMTQVGSEMHGGTKEERVSLKSYEAWQSYSYPCPETTAEGGEALPGHFAKVNGLLQFCCSCS